MKEFTRVITAQITHIMKVQDMFADDVEKFTLESQNISEEMMRGLGADNVTSTVQLFVRDIGDCVGDIKPCVWKGDRDAEE